MAENGFLSQEEIVALLSGESLPERNVKPDTAVPFPDQTDHVPECEEPVEYDTEDNSILIVLSDRRTYYFETAIVRRDGKNMWDPCIRTSEHFMTVVFCALIIITTG